MAEVDKRKIRKSELSAKDWYAALATLAHAFMNVEKCKVCLHPTVEGYVCYFCGQDDSSFEREETQS
jgi:hypothetical protein